MKIWDNILELGKSDHGTTALLLAILAMVLADLIPTPADAVVFWENRNLRDEWKQGKITPQQYWTRTVIAYYTYNSLWWLLVLIITANIPGDTIDKFKVAIALIGTGIVVGVIFNLYKHDVETLNPLPEPPKGK